MKTKFEIECTCKVFLDGIKDNISGTKYFDFSQSVRDLSWLNLLGYITDDDYNYFLDQLQEARQRLHLQGVAV